MIRGFISHVDSLKYTCSIDGIWGELSDCGFKKAFNLNKKLVKVVNLIGFFSVNNSMSWNVLVFGWIYPISLTKILKFFHSNPN